MSTGLGGGSGASLGFDVSSGVVALETLVAALNGYNATIDRVVISSVKLNAANQATQVSLKGITSEFDKFSATLKILPGGALQPVSVGLDNVGKTLAPLPGALTAAGNAADQAGKSFFNFSNLLKLAGRVTFVRFISEIIEGVKRARDEAIDLSKRIAEIQTISQDAQLSTEKWRQGLVALSLEFGKPVSDVAEGAYQAISNQVTKGAQSFRFLKDAMDFGRATVASTADSVNLLSSVLNSYNLTQEHTREISAQLFKTIELGRLRTADIANSFGRVGPTAHQLGIALEEVNAAIAVLTVKGIKSNVTLTFLEQFMIKLQKPTDEMAELMHRLGVPTGEMAAATFSLNEILLELRKSVKDGSSELGQLLSTVRAYQTFVGLAENGTEDFQAALEKIINSQENYNAAIKIGAENLSTDYAKAIEQVKTNLRPLGTLLARSTIGLINFNNEFAKLAQRVVEGKSPQLLFDIHAQAEESLKVTIDNLNQEQAAFNQSVLNRSRIFNKFVANIQAQLFEISQFHKVTNDSIVERLAASTNTSADFVEKALGKLTSFGKASLSEIQKIDGFIRQIEDQSEKIRFENLIKNLEQQKAANNAAAERQREALIKEKAGEAEAAQAITNIRIGELNKRQKEMNVFIDEQQASILRAARLESKEVFAQRKFAVPKEEIDATIARIKLLSEAGKDLLFKGLVDEAQRKFTEVGTLLGDLEKKSEQSFKTVDKQASHFWFSEDLLNQKRQQMKDFIEDIKRTQIDALKTFEQPRFEATQAAVAGEALIEKRNRLLAAEKALTKEADTQAEKNKALATSLSEATESAKSWTTAAQRDKPFLIGTEALNNARKLLDKALSSEDIAAIDKLLAPLQERFREMAREKDIFGQPQFPWLKSFMEDLTNVRKNIATIGTILEEQTVGEDKLQVLRDQINNVQDLLSNSAAQIQAIIDGTNGLVDSTGVHMDAVLTTVQTLNDALDAASAKLERFISAEAAAAAVTPGGNSRGGLIYFSRGGFTPRGTDTIPAMLTAGEFVVNRDSTRKFYSQLVAINNNRSGPKSLASGGVVTTVGDINISVKGGGTSSDTVRQIGKKLQREIRRGTLRLN